MGETARTRGAGVPAALLLAASLSFSAPPQAEGDRAFRETVRPFLEKHCRSCHGPEKQEAGVRFDRLEHYRPEDRALWTRVHELLSLGEMPPKKNARPAPAEAQAVLGWIAREQKALRGGGLRRLNRRELSAALRDLTGLSVDFAAALPGDGAVDGFDTGADGLQDAADSVDQALRIARRAVEGIRFLEPARAAPLAADFRAVKDVRKALDPWKAAGVVPSPRGFAKPGAGLLLEPKWLGEKGGFGLHVPPPADGRGLLRLRLSVCAHKPLPGLPDPHLWVEVGGQSVDVREISAPPEAPLELAYEVQLDDLAAETKGIAVSLDAKVELPYAVPGFENEDRSKPGETVPGGTGLFRPAFDRKKIPPDQQPVPTVVLRSLEIELDPVAPWPPAAWGAGVRAADDPASAARLLELWVERAWRRPSTEAERAPFLALYRERRARGEAFDPALRAAFQAVLMSGPFRYLAPASDSAHALASRLSFMLVGAPPDAELRRLAAQGRLRDSAALDAQVDRLLADPRSDAFVRPFVTQWLELGQPITVAMDHLQKQDFRFGRNLKASMREETLATVAELFAANRPAREIVSSDWTMMNESLAIHYGYPGVRGGGLRKVALRPDDPRGGGILGHAGIQSMLCWMGDNWVIYRGAWTLRHLLDDPPPPPPLEVPELNPSDAEHRGKSFRELLRRHQEDPKCAVCHDSIDPLGFAFQNFDLSGRWRKLEFEKYEKNELDGKVEWRGSGKPRPVDAAGRLPRGEEFRSFAECKDLIVRNYLDDVVRGILKNLVVYGAGRRPDVADLAEIRAILREQAPRGYPLRDLLKAVVRSRAFLGGE